MICTSTQTSSSVFIQQYICTKFHFRSFHIIFIENKVWKQVTFKHSTVFYHNWNFFLLLLYRTQQNLKMNYAVDLLMQRSLCYLWKWKGWLFKAHFTVLYYYGNLCTATQSILREIYDFFSCKNLHKLVLMIWKAFHSIKHSSGANAQGNLPEKFSDLKSN